MADAVSHTSKLHQAVAHQVSSDQANNPSKFFRNFAYKATLVTVFLVLLPLFPSIAPEFINQTLHARSWELLQLIFVGIAVSYGLFSKKNDEPEKDNDNAQSFVSKLLQVSSVFDDESENDNIIEENKFQTLNSQYYRGEPVVVLAKESPVVKQQNGEISQKPLLLPVRSLRQRVSETIDVDNLADGKNGWSKFTSNSRKPRNVEIGGLNVVKLEEKSDENVVLRSPIPWRSRSGRIEMKENWEEEEPELNRNIVELKSSRPNLSTPKKLSPTTSFSSRTPAPAPPPPPPPPPQFLRKSPLFKSNSTVANNAVSPDKVLRRSIRSVPAADELSDSETDTTQQNDVLAKSVRTYRSSEVVKQVDTIGHSGTTMMNRNFPKEDVRNESVDKVMMESSDDEESEDDYFEGSEGNGGGEAAAAAATDNRVNNDVGPDVDKKADEFIAKFREQIRLQRIESIRRSTEQRAGKTFR